jgi:hypothetical protein
MYLSKQNCFIFIFFNIRVSQKISPICLYLSSFLVAGLSDDCAHNFFIIVVTYLTFTIQLYFTTSGINMATLLTTCIKEERSSSFTDSFIKIYKITAFGTKCILEFLIQQLLKHRAFSSFNEMTYIYASLALLLLKA